MDVAPTFRDDAVQASVGWPLVEMTLQSSVPVVLTGILRPSEQGDRAWCRVHEFAEEFEFPWPMSPWCWANAGVGEGGESIGA